MEPTAMPVGYLKRMPKRRKKYFFLRLVFVILLYQQAMMTIAPNSLLFRIISYADEGCALALLFVFFWKTLNGFRLLPQERKVVLSFFILVCIGLLSNFFSALQPFGYVVPDVFLCGKFLFSYLGIRALYDGKISQDFLDENFNGIARFFSLLTFFLMLHEYLFPPFFEIYEQRYSINSLQLFYPHPSYLACSCVAVICILVTNLGRKPSNLIYIMMASTVAFMTLRTKAVAFVFLFLGLLIYTCILKLRSKFLLFLLLFLGALYIAWDQIHFYFFTSSDYARALMLKNSFVLANRYFPLGSGFATYGSYMASVHYSPLYWSFGYNGISGMSENAFSALSDGFWPIIIGQFGYLGLFCFLLILIYFFIMIFQVRNNDRYSYLGLLALMVYMLISSTSESAFFNSFAPMFFILFGIIISRNTAALVPEPTPAKALRSKYIRTRRWGGI